MSQPHEIEADTPALDAFLRAGAWRQVRGEQAIRAWVRELFATGRPEPEHLVEEDLPQRIMVMWRIVRATAIIKGLTAEDESLDSSTEISPDPWTEPFRPILTPLAGATLRRERAVRLLQIHAEGKGLPLLPPRLDEIALGRWCRASAIVAQDLGIERTEDGRDGLRGLLDPVKMRHCDVSSAEVLALEELILNETLDLLLDVGERATIKKYREEHGLTRKECVGLIRVTKASALARSEASIEEKRALQELRLEDFIGRAKETMNQDDEMKGIKELAKVQGLTRTEPENHALEFFNVVKRVSEAADKALLGPAPKDRTENVDPVTIEAEPAEDDFDAEALAEYDRENQHR